MWLVPLLAQFWLRTWNQNYFWGFCAGKFWSAAPTSSEALDLLHWAMHTVLLCHIAMAIEMASKVGVFFHCCVVDCCPGVRWSNME